MFTIKLTCMKSIAPTKLINVFFKLENESKQKLSANIKDIFKILETVTFSMLQYVGIFLFQIILIELLVRLVLMKWTRTGSQISLSMPFCISVLAL